MRHIVTALFLLLPAVALGQFDPKPQTRMVVTRTTSVTLDTIADVNAISVCLVDVKYDGNKGGLGSGVYIGSRWVLTAGHVVEGASSGRCVFGSSSIKADALLYSRDGDVGLVLLESDPPVEPQPMATTELTTGETAYIAGFDHGSQFRVYDGIVTAGTFSDASREIKHNDANKAVSGNSGGPIWNSRGEIVGNVHSAFDEIVARRDGIQFRNCSYGVSHDQMARFFQRVGERYPQYNGTLPQCGPNGCPPGVIVPPIRQPPQTVTGPQGPQGERGVPGAVGATGQQGELGLQGPQGPAGKDATVDIDALTKAVLARLPPFYPMWIDNDGNVIDEITDGVRLGQTLPLRIDVVLEAEANARARSR